jgi:hypothetical protein
MLKSSAIVAAAAVLSLGLSAASIAQTGPGSSSKAQPSAMQKCEGLTGAKFDECKRAAAPGRSEDSASRADSASPGRSGDATSRSGTAPGYAEPMEKGKK